MFFKETVLMARLKKKKKRHLDTTDKHPQKSVLKFPSQMTQWAQT